MEKFDAERTLALIEAYRVTHGQWVPTMFIRLLRLPAATRRRYDLASLRCAIHAAAPCPPPVKRRMIDWWGKILHEYYGGTESNGITMLDSEAWLAHPGSVGRAVVGVVKIVGEDGAELPPGTVGTIYFAGGPPFEYLNDPEGTARSRHPAGWTTIGDVGYVDGDGYLYLTDRRDHVIISGGVNIYPQESESLLLTHPRVVDAAVIGVPHPDLGEEVKAVVQAAPGAAGPDLEAELVAYCRARLSHVKCPRSVDFLAALPREDNGKLYKGRLRARYWAGRDSKIV